MIKITLTLLLALAAAGPAAAAAQEPDEPAEQPAPAQSQDPAHIPLELYPGDAVRVWIWRDRALLHPMLVALIYAWRTDRSAAVKAALEHKLARGASNL